MTATRLGVVTDVHLVFEGTNCTGSRVGDPEGWDLAGTHKRLLAAVALLEQQDLVGIVGLGDFAHHGDSETIDHVLAQLGRLPGGLWATAGNHDVAFRHDAVSLALQRSGRAEEPLANGHRLTVLEIESADWIMRCRARSVPAFAASNDGLDVLLSHFPLLGPPGRDPEPVEHLVDNDSLHGALAGRPRPTVVLSGHLHFRAARAQGPLLQLIFPALVELPAHCSVLELDEHDGRHQIRRTVLGLDGVSVAEDDHWEYDGTSWIDLGASA